MRPLKRSSQALMTAGAWKSLLLVLCAFAFVAVATTGFDQFGFGGRPWYGFFDANNGTTSQPYTFVIGSPTSGGASALAGVRDGNLVDLRNLQLDTEDEDGQAVKKNNGLTSTMDLHHRKG